MLPSPGFEPATLDFLSRDSTTELQRHSHLTSEILNLSTKDKFGSGPVLQSCQVKKENLNLEIVAGEPHFLVP